MNLFAISDLHLSFESDKPMDIFGEVWEDYLKRLEEKWFKTVRPEDCVLMAGDLSWAMHLSQAKKDFQYIERLPGQKIITKGNHDYWWSSLKKIHDHLNDIGAKSIRILHNHCIELQHAVICGTRGWKSPDAQDADQNDQKIFNRELHRLHLSLEDAKGVDKPKICMLHFPPFGPNGEQTAFTDLMQKNRVHCCVYGHVHRFFHVPQAVQGMFQGVTYYLTSADYLEFAPKRLNIP